MFISNRFLYLPHQRLPILARLQWNHPTSPQAREISPLIIGHRGSGQPSTNPKANSKNRLIGNTRRSIQAAIDAKVDWIEIDIRASKDEALVVFHDAEIDAKTTHTGKVEDMTLQDLKSYNIQVEPPEKILSLREVFAGFHTDKQHWILDIKAPGMSDDVIAQIEESNIPKEQVIIFGDHDVLEAYRDKGYRLGYITFFSNHRSMAVSPSAVFKRCKDDAYDLLVVPIVFVTPTFVASARENGVDIWSYGSDDPRDLKYCADCGVQGLIVDAPESAVSQFRN